MHASTHIYTCFTDSMIQPTKWYLISLRFDIFNSLRSLAVYASICYFSRLFIIGRTEISLCSHIYIRKVNILKYSLFFYCTYFTSQTFYIVNKIAELYVIFFVRKDGQILIIYSVNQSPFFKYSVFRSSNFSFKTCQSLQSP